MNIRSEDRKDKHLYFDVDSQIIGELGERLVTNNYVALSELIKNAYDADSPSVEIALENITKNDKSIVSKITVRDFGEGMTFDEIDEYWMTIATSNKLLKPVSKEFGRPKTGNKGVGRFSCQKLAKQLILTSISRVNGSYEKTIVTFNWSDFKPGMTLEKIPCSYSRDSLKEATTGVTLELIGLREAWTERDYKMLQKSIALISVAPPKKRDGFQEDPGFTVSMDCSDFNSDFSLVGESILNAGWGTLTGEISETGVLTLKLESKDSPTCEYSYPSNNKELAGICFKIYIIPGDSRYKHIDSRRNPKVLTKSLRTKISENESGIKLYYDGFRVYPYGDIENDDDWLGIARDIGMRNTSMNPALLSLKGRFEKINGFNFSRALLTHPSARAHIGSVMISGNAVKSFETKMDREGLSDTKNFRDLKSLIRLATDWSALNYEAFIRNNLSEQNRKIAEVFDNSINEKPKNTKDRVENALDIVKISTKAKHPPDVTTNYDVEDTVVSAAIEYIGSQIDDYSAELDTLRSIASTAPLMFVFSHEVKGVITSLLNHSLKLKSLSEQCQDTDLSESLLIMSEQARRSVNRYERLMKLFDVFSDAKNFSSKKAKVKNTIDSVIAGFDFLIETFDINVEVSHINGILRTRSINESQLYSLVINAFSNAIKAVIAKHTEKSIRIDVTETSSTIVISFYDSGVGIKKENRERVFKPFLSDPEEKIYSVLSRKLGDEQLTTLGRGSGLGLHIMKSIIDDARGDIAFVDCDSPWRTCLRMEIPK